MPSIATLIANPDNACITAGIAETMASSHGTGAPDWLAPGIACDIPLAEDADRNAIAAEIRESISNLPIDVVVQEATTRRKKVLLADMDSTMIGQECIDELAGAIGIKDKVAAITARAMNGDIAFEPALRERVALLKGLPVKRIAEVIDTRISLASGGKILVATMKKHGGYAALVSGGFTAFTSKIARKLGFDENRANILLEEDGHLTGEVAEPILGREAKVSALHEVAAKLGVTSRDVIAVGDGANDLDMLAEAGSGVALHAKPVVAEKAQFRIDHGDLTALLYLQGYRQEEFAG